MRKEDYIKTIYVEGIPVDIGIDDYGQSYYFEWFDGEKLCEQSCGTYNTDYIPMIYFELCPRYRDLWMKDLKEGLNLDEQVELKSWEEKIRKEQEI